jgi:hypothetical protein
VREALTRNAAGDKISTLSRIDLRPSGRQGDIDCGSADALVHPRFGDCELLLVLGAGEHLRASGVGIDAAERIRRRSCDRADRPVRSRAQYRRGGRAICSRVRCSLMRSAMRHIHARVLVGDGAAIKAFVAALRAEPRVIHPITNISGTGDGDTATAGACWQDVRLVNGAPGVVIQPLRGHAAQDQRPVADRQRHFVIEVAPPATAQ